MEFTAVFQHELGTDHIVVVPEPRRGQAGAAVFTDASGRRSAWVGRALAAITVVTLGFLAVVSATLIRGAAAPAAPRHHVPQASVTEVPAPNVKVQLRILDTQGLATAPSR